MIGHPRLIALAYWIERDRTAYCEQFEAHQKPLEVIPWLLWFGETILRAQQTTLELVAFFIAKTRFYDRCGTG